MAWISCTLDKSPVGNLTLIDDSGFSYSATVQTDKPDEVTKFIAIANQEISKILAVNDTCTKAAAAILTQAQK